MQRLRILEDNPHFQIVEVVSSNPDDTAKVYIDYDLETVKCLTNCPACANRGDQACWRSQAFVLLLGGRLWRGLSGKFAEIAKEFDYID